MKFCPLCGARVIGTCCLPQPGNYEDCLDKILQTPHPREFSVGQPPAPQPDAYHQLTEPD